MMTIEEILVLVRTFDGSFVLSPAEGSQAPGIAWGDHFCYYAPDGIVASNRQPYATIVTKDYPDEPGSSLDGDRFRVNIRVGPERFERLVGHSVRDEVTVDYSLEDTVLPHPVYARQGWIAVVDPGVRTRATVSELLRAAHDAAHSR